MVFKIKYDPSSNVKFVKCVEKYPVIYKDGNCLKNLSDKSALNALEWEKVAQEINSTTYFCRDRWTNLVGCYKRFLRQKSQNISKKPYYLAKHMEFLKPFLKIKSARSKRFDEVYSNSSEGINHFSCEHDKAMELKDYSLQPVCLIIDSSDEEENNIERDYSVNILDNGTNNCIESFGDEEDLDFCFFKSLLPDIRLMSSQQKLKFRKSILNAVDLTLYGEDLKTFFYKS
uniref:MADF domain-containing protein n=1 Tax=Clastoptera arizonana TaxID=38151 RepID=A0A1B6CUU5_9HEMI